MKIGVNYMLTHVEQAKAKIEAANIPGLALESEGDFKRRLSGAIIVDNGDGKEAHCIITLFRPDREENGQVGCIADVDEAIAIWRLYAGILEHDV